jgi:HAE1 family hydrophobic/amphiphilic exporter-1
VGTTVIGGMLLSTVLNLIFIPALYVILSSLLARFKRARPVPADCAEVPSST